MNKLIKECTFGEYKFKIGINREIALQVAEKFPNDIANFFDNTERASNNVKTLIKQGKLRDVLEKNDMLNECSERIVKFALPLMLKEANEDLPADDIIEYAIKNDADQILYINMLEVIFMGFTTNGETKTPKISFTME